MFEPWIGTLSVLAGVVVGALLQHFGHLLLLRSGWARDDRRAQREFLSLVFARVDEASHAIMEEGNRALGHLKTGKWPEVATEVFGVGPLVAQVQLNLPELRAPLDPYLIAHKALAEALFSYGGPGENERPSSEQIKLHFDRLKNLMVKLQDAQGRFVGDLSAAAEELDRQDGRRPLTMGSRLSRRRIQ